MNSSDSAATAGAGIGLLAIFLVYAVIIVLALLIYGKIVSKAGYPGWYALLMLVPCVNLIALVMFAFQEWPIERELNQWRASGGGGAYPRYGQTPPPGSPYDPPPPQG